MWACMRVFGQSEIIYFDKSGRPYRMIKVNGKWHRIEFDPWDLQKWNEAKE